jgi:hypothetical protein
MKSVRGAKDIGGNKQLQVTPMLVRIHGPVPRDDTSGAFVETLCAQFV